MSQLPYCQLKLYHNFLKKGEKPLNFDSAQRLFKGNVLHNAVRKALFEARKALGGYTYLNSERELTLNVQGHTLKGHYDHLALVFGKLTLIDFKFVRSIKPIKTPHQHYLDQISLYAYAYNQASKKPIEQIGLIYVDVNFFDSIEFFQPPTFVRIPMLLKKFEDLCLRIDQQRPPTKPFSSPNETWECRYCPYYGDCWPTYGSARRRPFPAHHPSHPTLSPKTPSQNNPTQRPPRRRLI